MQELKGIGASAGIAIAKAYRLEEPDLTVEKKNISDSEAEVSRFDEAIARSKEELEKIKEHALKELGQDKADIFSAHLLVLSDPELLNPVKEKISTDSVNAEFALKETSSMFVTMFESMDNEYMKERRGRYPRCNKTRNRPPAWRRNSKPKHDLRRGYYCS